MPPRILPIPLGNGMNEAGDPRHQSADQPTDLQNVAFDKDQGLYPRRGYSSMVPFGFTAVKRVAAFRDELLAFSGTDVHTHVPSATSNQWKNRDQTPNFFAQREVISAGYDIEEADVAYTGYSPGVELYVFSAIAFSAVNNAILVTLRDTTTGAFYCNALDITNNVANNYIDPQAFIVGSTAYVFYRISGSGQIRARTLNLNSLPTVTWSAEILLGTLVTGASGWDICDISALTALAPAMFAVVGRDPGGAGIVIQKYDAALATVGAAGVLAAGVGGAPFGITAGIAGAAVAFFVAYGVAAGPDVNYRAINANTLLDVWGAPGAFGFAFTANNVGIVPLSSTELLVVASQGVGGSATNARMWWKIVNSATGAIIDFLRDTRTVWMASKPFVRAGRAYCVVDRVPEYAIDRNQQSLWLVSLETHIRNGVSAANQPKARVVATLAARTHKSINVAGLGYGSAPHVASVDGQQFLAIAATRMSLETDVNRPVTTITRCLINANHPNQYQSAALGEHLYLAGGVPAIYDGHKVTEVGFHYQPDQPQAARVAVVGSLTAGAYRYILVFEERDPRGAVHRSIPSTPSVAITSLGGDSGEVTPMRHLNLTARQEVGDTDRGAAIYIVLYRTKVGGVAPYYRVTDQIVPMAWLNDPSAATFIPFVDGLADASLGEQLYTTGGVLENVAPCAFQAVVAHRNRIWAIGDDGRTVWFSKEYLQGEAPGFNEGLTFAVEDDGRPLTALGTLDDKLVCFKRDSIYVVAGQGPNDSGGGNDLSPPQRISSDVGCIDQRSVVEIPAGVMFQSVQGLCLLTRSLEVKFVGDQVSATTTAYPVCTSAVRVPDQQQVRFTMQTAEDAYNGVTLVLDYRLMRWARWFLWKADGSGSQTAGIQSACWHPTYKYIVAQDVANNPAVWTESALAYTDVGSFVPLLFESPWIPLGAGLQGDGWLLSIAVLGERISTHNLRISVAYDYSTSYTAVTFDSTAITALGVFEAVKVRFGRQRATAVRVKIEAISPTLADGTPVAGIAACTLAELALEIESADSVHTMLPTGAKK